MGVGEGTSNGGGAECSARVQSLKGETFNKGFGFGNVNNGGEGSSGGRECFQTYKRRKNSKSSSESEGQVDGIAHAYLACELADQKHWRDVVLKHVFQTLSEGEGIHHCIRDALIFHPEIGCTTMVKDSVCCDEDKHERPSQAGGMPRGSKNGHVSFMSNGSLNGDHHTITHSCQRAFFNIIVSEKFASLCKLLLGNFQGLKVDGFFDFSLINSRMIEGTYEHLPMLFSSDIQQVWTKLQGIGTEMISIAKSLSDMSRTSFYEQVEFRVHSPSGEGKREFSSREANSHANSEQTEPVCGLKNFTCRHCGNKADERDCLVCDSCEELYHVACIEPAVEEIPPRSWYCASCTAGGVGSFHENCVVCERLNAPRCLSNGTDKAISASEETLDDVEENSYCSMEDEHGEGENLRPCKICHIEVENDDKFRICGHPFCPSKYFHVKCLTTKQLKSFGPRWYCPSCLCRVCLIDQDDDQIVLCDGCDHAYHLYCMNPPRTSIPRGKWFCRKCDAGTREKHTEKRAYGKHKNRPKKKGGWGKRAYANLERILKEEDKSDKGSGGMDVLLTAAKTLNNEEELGYHSDEKLNNNFH